jgi:tetratricopeptide (TPR) repeat protein/transcriptional regulator with XRE-family HTH domain
MAEFGPQLRRRREAAGLSLTGFAALTHFTKGYLSKVETGRARPNRALAEICDRSLDAGGELLALVPAEPLRPDELPAVTAYFVGRADEVARLTAALRDRNGPAAQVITGLGGLGKTTVAVAAARAAADAFPDGQFLIDLSPSGATAPTESECLDRALRALGVAGRRIPPDRAGRAALLRSRVGRQHVLLLVDGADSAGQVRSLLSADPACRVLVTSRHRLAALDDAEHLALGPLPEAAGAELFREISAAAEDDPIDELVRRCGSVPLAIRIVAARLRYGGWSCAEMLDRLTDEAGRIASMDDGERSMAAVLGASLDALAPEERDLLVLLGLHPGPVADLPATAALAARSPGDVEAVLVRLHESSLVTRHPGGLVVLHDLVRAHLAAAEVPRLPAATRRDALGRLVDHVVARVAAADTALEPHRYRPPLELPPVDGFGTVPEALEWLRLQWPVAVAVTAAARAAGMLERSWQLGFLLRGFFFREKLTEPWLRSGRDALSAADEAGAAVWAGMLRNSLGMAHLERGDLAEAAHQHEVAEQVLEAAGDPIGATDARASLAWVRLYQGAYEQALGGFALALDAYRRLERPRSECITLRGMALAAAWLGRDDEACRYADAAAPLARTPLDRAMTDNCVGWVHYRAGRYRDAARRYEAAARTSRAESDYELVRALTGLGNSAAATGDRAGAAERWREADELGVWLDVRCVGEAAARQALTG